MKQLGSYKILYKLGEGAMGEVYLGQHKHMHLLHAIKVLSGALATNAECRKRFISEARIMATMRHPNIVQVHAMELEGNVNYIVMDFVSPDGRTSKSLDNLLSENNGRLSPWEAERIIKQVSAALAYSHKLNIIHCDIKPANILVDKNGAVRVTDFGLAKVAGADFIRQSIARSMSESIGVTDTISHNVTNAVQGQSLGSQETISGGKPARAASLVGTLNYMPPEVQQGGEWTPQSDIYSLGVLTYQLLTGTLPIGRWKPPSMMFKDIPVFWDKILDCALHIDPDKRFLSAEQFVSACGQKTTVDIDHAPYRKYAALAAICISGIAISFFAFSSRKESETSNQEKRVNSDMITKQTGMRSQSPDSPLNLPEGSFPKANPMQIQDLQNKNLQENSDQQTVIPPMPVVYDPPGYSSQNVQQNLLTAQSLVGTAWLLVRDSSITKAIPDIKVSFDTIERATLGYSKGTWQMEGNEIVITYVGGRSVNKFKLNVVGTQLVFNGQAFQRIQ